MKLIPNSTWWGWSRWCFGVSVYRISSRYWSASVSLGPWTGGVYFNWNPSR